LSRKPFDEAIQALGEPIAIHHTKSNYGCALRFAVIGIVISVVIASVMLFILEDWGVFGPKIFGLSLLNGLFGIVALRSVLQNRNITIYRYSDRLIIYLRGRMINLQASQITKLYLSGVKHFHAGRYFPECKQYSLLVTEQTFFSWGLWVYFGEEKERIYLSSFLDDWESLAHQLQTWVFDHKWPEVYRRFQAGLECGFGYIRVDFRGIHSWRDELARWDEIGSITIDNTLQIRKTGCNHPWHTPVIWNIPNPHFLMALIQLSLSTPPEPDIA
jgi:hypothetical protein